VEEILTKHSTACGRGLGRKKPSSSLKGEAGREWRGRRRGKKNQKGKNFSPRSEKGALKEFSGLESREKPQRPQSSIEREAVVFEEICGEGELFLRGGKGSSGEEMSTPVRKWNYLKKERALLLEARFKHKRSISKERVRYGRRVIGRSSKEGRVRKREPV